LRFYSNQDLHDQVSGILMWNRTQNYLDILMAS